MTTESVKEAGAQVSSTAKDQARDVAGEARTQARDLMNQTQEQVRTQVSDQKSKAVGNLRGLADELRAVANGQPASDGRISGIADQAAEAAQQFAVWLESREPGDLLEDVRAFARRRPGAFLLGAAAAGVLAGRLTRGAVDAKQSAGTSAGTLPQAPPQPTVAATTPQQQEAIVVEESITVGSTPVSSTRPGGERL